MRRDAEVAREAPDEVGPFACIRGRRQDDVTLAPGQIFVVPRGVQHCPTTTDEALVLMSEPQGTPNTGDAGGERTREPDELP